MKCSQKDQKGSHEHLICDSAPCQYNDPVTLWLPSSQLPVWTRGERVQLDWQYSRGACPGTRWAFCRWSSRSDQQIHAQLQGFPLNSLCIQFHLYILSLPAIAIFYDIKWQSGSKASRSYFFGVVCSDYIFSLFCVFSDGLFA